MKQHPGHILASSSKAKLTPIGQAKVGRSRVSVEQDELVAVHAVERQLWETEKKHWSEEQKGWELQNTQALAGERYIRKLLKEIS